MKKNISYNSLISTGSASGIFVDDNSLIKSTFLSSEKPYILTVKDMPSDERPREKLLIYGPQALSMSELLAVVLGTGTKKEEVFLMSSRIIKEYGEKNILMRKDAQKIAEEISIPIGKALQIVAVGELGRRSFSKNDTAVAVIRNAKDVFEYTRDMGNLSKEHLRGIYLNSHYKVIHDEIISIGTIDTSVIHPREVFKPAIEYSSVAIIIVHNHPSGILSPSSSDISVTKQLIDAGKLMGIDVIDHVIVTKDSFMSIINKE